MRRIGYLAGGSILAITLSLGLTSGAMAQTAGPVEVEEVVVTGSLIAGTPENAALPVDVIGAEELAKQGSPTTVELLKGLSVSNGVLGDTNQFDSRAQGSEGSGSVNLRGLGPTRTLVLLNGRRMAINPFALAGAGAVDTNIIPSAAIGRVEVLKDGAAATYGSDAIAGVVNFITRKNFEGLELSASYRAIDGSDGDYTASAVYGWSNDDMSFLLTAGYQHRSMLPVTERDWANLEYQENPEGGWSAAGNPSTFIPLASTANRFRDSECSPIGGYSGFSGTTPVCYWHYTQYDNLVEKEDRYQIYGQWDFDLNADTTLHVEGLYAHTEVPDWKTSPSYALLSTPTATTSPVPGQYYVPATNPGLIAYMAAHPGGIPAFNGATGVGITLPAAVLGGGALIVASRPYGMGGNPMFGYGPSEGSREFDAFRFATDLTGKFNDDINWNIGVSYSEETGTRTGYDTVVSRYQLALRGLGGEGCNGIVAGLPGSTCEWFNPFSSAVPGNAITGQTNTAFNPALENSAELTRWFFQKAETEQTSTLFVVEGLVNGKTGWELPGGDVLWAIGAQYRKSAFQARYNDISNRAVNPCIDTPVNGSTSCSAPQGPLAFLGVGSNANLSQDVYAVFGELVVPVTEDFNATLAARYEDYGGAVGSTFDPKLSLRWQVSDWVALRGSVGTTFRAPPAVSLNPDFVTSLQSINGTFRAVDIYGNPDLQPESATTYSLGTIFEIGGFRATIDYWNFDFQDPIVTDPVSGLVAVVFPQGIGAGAQANCASPLAARFSFTGGASCASFASAAAASTAITRVRTNTVNGAGVQTSGVDVMVDWTFDDVFGGELTIGGTGTYVHEYKTDATEIEGVVVAPAFDAVGLLNYQTTAYPLPRRKGSLYAEYTYGPHNLRWTIRYIDQYRDQRLSPFAAGTYFDDAPVRTPLGALTQGKTIDAFITSDVTYRVFLPWDATLALSVDNVFDEDPPFARLDLNYDPFTASGLGRTWKASLTKKF